MKLISHLVEVHIFRRKKNGIEFLLLKRAENEIYPGLWQMVSGKIKKGEKGYVTALREIKEETNMIPLSIWVAPNINSFYYPEKDCISFLPVFVAEVSVNSVIKISEEHSSYKWVKADKAKKMLAWPGQRKSVDAITEYFSKPNSLLNFIKIEMK